MNDTPKRIVVHHNNKVEALTQQAESFHLQEAWVNTMQTQKMPTGTIKPGTGHVTGADCYTIT